MRTPTHCKISILTLEWLLVAAHLPVKSSSWTERASGSLGGLALIIININVCVCKHTNKNGEPKNPNGSGTEQQPTIQQVRAKCIGTDKRTESEEWMNQPTNQPIKHSQPTIQQSVNIGKLFRMFFFSYATKSDFDGREYALCGDGDDMRRQAGKNESCERKMCVGNKGTRHCGLSLAAFGRRRKRPQKPIFFESSVWNRPLPSQFSILYQFQKIANLFTHSIY